MKKRCLPNEVKDVLNAIKDKFSVASWELADILSDLETELGEPLPRGETADELGILPSQVSSLILTAQRITQETREEFDGLAFSCFQYAARDNSPVDVLHLSLILADSYGGKPGGVRVVRAIVKERAGGGNANDKPRAWSGHIVTINDACYALLCTGDERPIDGSAGTWRETQ